MKKKTYMSEKQKNRIKRVHGTASMISPKRATAYILDKYDKVYKAHCRMNRKIRKSIKPIIKPDLDEIMDQALKNKD